ncbi:MAG: DUF4198 domain-containing protein [Steroidobacter sp.]
MSARSAVLCSATLFIFIGSAQAHSPFLLPNVFDLDKRDHVTVLGSFTEEFFAPDVVMKSDDYHVVEPDGARRPLTPVYTRDVAIIEPETKEQGTYRISTGRRTGRTAKAAWVQGDWKFLAPSEVAPAGSRVYDVTSITVAETYVTRGKPSQTALAPRNSGLEFRAITHPNAVFASSPATFQLLFDGKPVASQVVSVYAGDARYSDQKAPIEVKTDATGQFAIKLDRNGVFVAMTRYRPEPAVDGKDGVSYTYSLVFEATD